MSTAEIVEGGIFEAARHYTATLQPDTYYLSITYIECFYHHRREDLKLLHEVGYNMYRLSISWTVP
ncbi:family 1 glycosylhydrolase [Lactiplantibacillus daoliensis]|uniref:family 1 glycosylhydrolase n=1 Tax=Lactiplantibacillus daoliensis TaxID=2559916 RepID=UPI0010F66E34